MKYQRENIVVALMGIENVPQRERERRRANRAFPKGKKITAPEVETNTLVGELVVYRQGSVKLKALAKGHLRKVIPATLVPKTTSATTKTTAKVVTSKPMSTAPTAPAEPKKPTAYQAAILADPKKYGVGFGRGKNHTPDQYRARKELWATLAH